jgi:hypothetical protein
MHSIDNYGNIFLTVNNYGNIKRLKQKYKDMQFKYEQ